MNTFNPLLFVALTSMALLSSERGAEAEKEPSEQEVLLKLQKENLKRVPSSEKHDRSSGRREDWRSSRTHKRTDSTHEKLEHEMMNRVQAKQAE